MMTKEESIELAEKCGAVVDNFVSDDRSDYTVEFRQDEFAAYTSAIEEKHQAQIAMHVNTAKTILKEMGENYYEHEPMNSWAAMLNESISATQETADAWEAEVKARALEEASKVILDENSAGKLRFMAQSLRNQQPEQPRKPCTCDGWCDGLCLEKEGKRK